MPGRENCKGITGMSPSPSHTFRRASASFSNGWPWKTTNHPTQPQRRNQSRPMEITEHDIGTYLVQSESDEETSYIVDLEGPTCTCPRFMDYGQATSREPCKHIEAVLYYVATLQFYEP